MSGRPRTTSFAEGNKGPLAAVNFPGMKITSKLYLSSQEGLCNVHLSGCVLAICSSPAIVVVKYLVELLVQLGIKLFRLSSFVGLSCPCSSYPPILQGHALAWALVGSIAKAVPKILWISKSQGLCVWLLHVKKRLMNSTGNSHWGFKN